MIDLLHTFNFALIIVIFINRLKLALKGSMFDYSRVLYKFLQFMTIIVSIFGSISVTINRTNTIYQLSNNTIDKNI